MLIKDEVVVRLVKSCHLTGLYVVHGGGIAYAYIGSMTKQHATTETMVREAKTGRMVTVRCAGALKGHLTLRKGFDLTKPIASQAAKIPRKASPATKH